MPDEILIIDKDTSHANALSVYLERKRMGAYMASTCEDAIVLFDNIRSEIVLADPGLPDMEMVSLLRRIKATHPKLQIIVMVTPDQFDHAMAELKYDVVHYLMKPVKSSALDMALYQAKSWISLNKRLEDNENKLKIFRHTQTCFKLIDTPVKGCQHSLDTMRHGSDHEPQRCQMILELPDLRNVGGHFHDLGDLSVTIAYGGRPGENVVLVTRLGCDHLFGGVGASIFESVRHGTLRTGRTSVLVYLKAVGANFVPKILFEHFVCCREAELLVLDGNITGNFIE